jgi:hypothetical protein
MKLPSRVSLRVPDAQGVSIQDEHASLLGNAGYGHSAAIELILARAASTHCQADVNAGACVQQARPVALSHRSQKR